MGEQQIKSRQRVAERGELFTAEREVNAMLDLVKQETERIDDAVYFFGASLKDAGKRLFAYIRMQETSAPELLNAVR